MEEGQSMDTCDPKPMAEWVNEESDDGKCRPCVIPDVVEEYRSAFTKIGKESEAEELDSLYDMDPDEVCHALDNIVNEAEGELKDTLLGINCSIQSQGGIDIDDEDLVEDEDLGEPVEEVEEAIKDQIDAEEA